MNRQKIIEQSEHKALYQELKALNLELEVAFKEQFNRSLPFADGLLDRWERAQRLGFGEGTNIYDSSYVLGDVKVGKNTWIGMFTVLDGSGGLIIGDCCTISVGVHIYTHDNVLSTVSNGRMPFEKASVNIGNNTYIGPQVVISKGINIGNQCIIGANSFVNKDISDNSIVVGNPAKLIGYVKNTEGGVKLEYLI